MSLMVFGQREDRVLHLGMDRAQMRSFGLRLNQLQTTTSNTVLVCGDACDIGVYLRDSAPSKIPQLWFPITRSDPRLIARLGSLFLQRDASTVASYLSNRPSVVNLLIDIWEQLTIFFPNYQYRLRLVTDDEGSQNLLVEIPTSLPVEEAMRNLEKFDDGWWIGAMASAEGQVVVDVTFE